MRQWVRLWLMTVLVVFSTSLMTSVSLGQTTGKTKRALVWIDSENGSPAVLAETLLKRGWNFEFFAATNSLAADLAETPLILVTYRWLARKNIPSAFWKEHVVPAVKRGAVLVMSAYGEPDLNHHLGGDWYLQFSWLPDDVRQTTYVVENSFAKTPHDATKILSGRTPPGAFKPGAPDKWVVLARQLMKNGEEWPFMLARPCGKGLVIVGCLIDQHGQDGMVQLLDNLLEYNKTIERD